MPKKKITLDEAYAVFEQHGLQVEVKGLTPTNAVTLQPSDLVEQPIAPHKPAFGGKTNNPTTIKITLYCKHSIARGGFLVVNEGEKSVEGNSIETYGPGVISVPIELAAQLQHQDAVARQAEANMLSSTFKSKVIVQRGKQYVPLLVSDEPDFRMSRQYFDNDVPQYQGIPLR